MKYADVQKLHDAGLITGEQRQKIVEHFNLKEDSNRFLVIISFVGAILVAAGIALLIAAHWEEIPRGIKLAGGILLMLGAHGIGWWLREVKRNYMKTGEALHLAGSLVFLANIALVGSINHSSEARRQRYEDQSAFKNRPIDLRATRRPFEFCLNFFGLANEV